MMWFICDCHRLFLNRTFLFVFACISGFLFAFVWRQYEQTVQLSSSFNRYSTALADTGYGKWLQQAGLVRHFIPGENISYGENNEEMESSYLHKTVPVLCMIFVKSHKAAVTIKNTWAKHCNIATFFGSFIDDQIPVLKVSPVSFHGFCQAFVSTWIKYRGDSMKWMIIADDKTYAIIDNLRYYVAPLNSSHPYYLGHAMKDFSNKYNVGAAGIVLSHAAMELLFSVYPDGESCMAKSKPSVYYDVAIGRLLRNFEVTPVDTRDQQSRGRFNPFSVEKMLIPSLISIFNSYWRSSVYLSSDGKDCCSNYAITFHGIYPAQMYLFEYVMYHLKPIRNSYLGIGNKPPTAGNIHKKARSNVNKEYGKPFISSINMIEKSHLKAFPNNAKEMQHSDGVLQKLWKEMFF